MKRKITLSSILSVALLAGTMSLSAATAGLNDTVAQKEAQALKNPAEMQGNPSAKAKEEEIMSKDEFLAKIKAPDFAKEARLERMKRLRSVFARERAFHAPLKQPPKEIMEAVHLTFTAAQEIQQGKDADAAKALEKASADFDKALKANPKLDLLPVAEEVVVKSFAGDSKIIAEALRTADALIKQHRTQDAREILMPLRDEIDFTTQFLPMKSYPVATKKAAELLKKGKKKEALATLAAAFGTLVSVVDVVPTPLLLAEDMVSEASKLAKEKKAEALKLLNGAEEQLKRAELLGYTSRHAKAYAELKKQIEAIKAEIGGKNETKGLYEKLKKSFESLKEAVRKDKH